MVAYEGTVNCGYPVSLKQFDIDQVMTKVNMFLNVYYLTAS